MLAVNKNTILDAFSHFHVVAFLLLCCGGVSSIAVCCMFSFYIIPLWIFLKYLAEESVYGPCQNWQLPQFPPMAYVSLCCYICS